MAEHTPGPWWIWDETHVMAGKGNRPAGLGERLVANCGGLSSNVNPGALQAENAANARLIAAAPETAAERDRLRHELAGLRQWVRDGYAKKSVLERFDAALAKPKEPADGQ